MVMVWVMIVMMQLVQMIVVAVAVEPERIRFGERGCWWPERLLLSGLRRAPVHVFVGGRRPYDGIQWRELGVGRSGGVETTSAAISTEE